MAINAIKLSQSQISLKDKSKNPLIMQNRVDFKHNKSKEDVNFTSIKFNKHNLAILSGLVVAISVNSTLWSLRLMKVISDSFDMKATIATTLAYAIFVLLCNKHIKD